MHEHHQNQLQTIKTTHKQESVKAQQEIEKLSVSFLLFHLIDHHRFSLCLERKIQFRITLCIITRSSQSLHGRNGQ